MSEQSVDNTISYTQKPGWKMLAFLCVFMIAGVISIVKFDSYFTDFWKIRKCDPEGYANGDFMTFCRGIKVDRYAFGSIYLGAQKNAVKNAEDADVIIFGNSRTMRSFSTDTMDSYFKEKGLSYMVLASEGASFRSAVLTSERMKIKPKIVMVNSEIFFSDKVSPAFRDLVDFPDKYKTRYSFFNAAQTLHKKICGAKGTFLKKTYCKGTSRTNWRSAETGRFKWDLIAEPEKQVPFSNSLKEDHPLSGLYTDRAIELFEMQNYRDSCPVFYLVNSPRAAPKLMESIAKSLGIQSVFAYINGLASYDKSHLDRPTSERWAGEFVKALDPVVDNCLEGKGKLNVVKPEKFDLKTADIIGASDFETWRTRFGMSVEDAAVKSPDGKLDTDVLLTSDTANARLYKSFNDTPIKAGTTMKFGGWFWTEEDGVRVRAQIIRGCSSTAPLESNSKSYKLSPDPQRVTIEHTFANDQKCGVVLLTVNKPNASLNAWQGRIEYDVPSPE
ncbi:hypothetical protein N9M10_01455 [Hellea sp.]|nr:hypothetical protein [Hellea sp.]